MVLSFLKVKKAEVPASPGMDSIDTNCFANPEALAGVIAKVKVKVYAPLQKIVTTKCDRITN
jgi:hypothetical protein